MPTGELDKLIYRIENGELSEQEELALLVKLNFSYKGLNIFLEEIKVASLKLDLAQ